ncbi:MAG: glutamine amidotransferase [Thermodesulfobacteriota bacterium]
MDSAVSKFALLNPPGLAEIALILILFTIVVYGSLRSSRHLKSSKRRIVLASLHAIAFITVIFILTNPALKEESYKEEKKTLAVVVDGSWSMNLAGGHDGGSRIESVRGFFGNNADFFTRLGQNFLLDYYTFDETLKPSSQESILKQKPTGKHTNLGKLLDELAEKQSRGELDEALIISDGGGSRQSPDAAFDEALGKADFRINTAGALTEDATDDIWIDKISSNEVSFLRYPYSISAAVKSGGPAGMRIPVSLYEGDKLVSIKEVYIDPNTKQGEAEFEINPITLGRKIYTVSIPVLTDELVPENNRKSFYTDVIINKIRVLHVAGSPSWDVRFLRKALKRNPNIDLVSFFILRDPSDLVFATENELSLIPFPVNEIFGNELPTFDVVIFQNFNFQPYGIFGFHLRSIRDYVMNDGGAFLMIGGNKSFDSGNYGRTPISEILPVELGYMARTLTDTISGEVFRPKLTSAGKNHPIMRIVPDREANEKLWNAMPELEGFNMVEGMSPDAVPLLVSPEGEPILAVANVGTGKAATFLSDSSWRWNFVYGSEGDVSPLYEKFWNRLFLWFVNDPELKDIRVETDKAVYSPGENAEVGIWDLSGDGSGEGRVKTRLTLPDGTSAEIEPERDSRQRLAAKIMLTEPGIYGIAASPDDGADFSDSQTSEASFIVEPPGDELRGVTTNLKLLKSIAGATGGKYITTRDDPEGLDIENSRKKTITGYKTVLLWDNPLFFMLIMGLLFSEWSLRRKWGLK